MWVRGLKPCAVCGIYQPWRRTQIAKSVLPDFKDGSNVWLSAEEAAKCAVHYADALISELKKGTGLCD